MLVLKHFMLSIIKGIDKIFVYYIIYEIISKVLSDGTVAAVLYKELLYMIYFYFLL